MDEKPRPKTLDEPSNKNNPGNRSGKPKPRDNQRKPFTKRPTSKPYQRKNDIYITNKSNFKAQLNQCNEILTSGEFSEIYLHCLGAAITRGINLALKLVEESKNGYGYEANTSTIELVDDYHPLCDDDDFEIRTRSNSSLHIRIYRQSNVLLKKESAGAGPSTSTSI